MHTVKDTYYFGTRNVPHRVTRFVAWERHSTYLGKVYLEGPRGAQSVAFVRKDGSCHK